MRRWCDLSKVLVKRSQQLTRCAEEQFMLLFPTKLTKHIPSRKNCLKVCAVLLFKQLSQLMLFEVVLFEHTHAFKMAMPLLLKQVVN